MSNFITKLANLVKALPTGTVFLFLFLCPVFTNDGSCQTINKYLTSLLIAFCGFSCGFACFTDSYKDTDGKIHYGIVTITGLWPHKDSGSVNLSNYKLRFSDFVHALLSVTVFSVVVLLYPNTVKCFYPSFQSVWLVKWLPLVIGVVSAIYSLFPIKRHGIGYHPSDYTLLG